MTTVLQKPTIDDLRLEVEAILTEGNDIPLPYLGKHSELIRVNCGSKKAIIDAILVVAKKEGWDVRPIDLKRNFAAHKAFEDRGEVASVLPRCGHDLSSSGVSENFKVGDYCLEHVLDEPPRIKVICPAYPQVEAVSSDADGRAIVQLSLLRRAGTEADAVRRVSVPLRAVKVGNDGLYSYLADAHIAASSDMNSMSDICEFIKAQVRACSDKPIQVFQTPGIDARNGVIVGEDSVIYRGEIVLADARGRLFLKGCEEPFGFLPMFHGQYIVPKFSFPNSLLPSLVERKEFIAERSHWRGPMISLLDANLLARLFVSPSDCREYGHSMPFPYVTGASGNGKDDAVRDALHLHFGFPVTTSEEAGSGSTLPILTLRLALSRMPVVVSETNKGDEYSLGFDNKKFSKFVLSAYDGASNSHMYANLPTSGFLVLIATTVPNDSDELGKRIDEVEIRRQSKNAAAELAVFKKNVARMRGVILDLQLKIFADHSKSKEMFWSEYAKAQKELSTWPEFVGRDPRVQGHAALSLAAARCVDRSWPIAAEVENALRIRLTRVDTASRFNRTKELLDICYQVLSTRIGDRAGCLHLIEDPSTSGTQRYLCLALGSAISQIRAALGSRWLNPCKEAHVYENLGLTKSHRENRWCVRIPRDRNRKGDTPLQHKELLLLALDHAEFPEELVISTENLAGLCKQSVELYRSAPRIPWGDFQQLVEGGADVG